MDEDLTGKPFVGQAGKLLTDIIRAMGLTRDQVYICNIVKCHPPGNRDPEADEIETCLPFLREQITLIQPEVICTLGRISLQSLVDKRLKITRDRGRWYSYMDIPLMPTYHPAYLLRYPQAKKQVWEDVQMIMKKLGLTDPRQR
jgi:uracil-DNA glycosylase family 4